MRKRLAIAGMVAALAATISLTGGALRGTEESAKASSAAGGTGRSSRRSSGAAQRTRVLTSSSGSRTSSSRVRPETPPTTPLGASSRAGAGARASQCDDARCARLARTRRHDFRGGLAYGRRAARIAPYSALHYGVIGDAMIELGRYEGAFAAFDRMVELRPSSSAYARVSYARELLGRPQDAEAMRLALASAAGHQERSAWVLSHLGKLAFSQGKTAVAARRFRAALAVSPGYGSALEGLGHVEAARGRVARAIG